MRKAALGFKYISLKDEMIIPEDDDFENWKESKKLSTHDRIKLTKLRCYHKNKEKYNRSRRINDAKVASKYSAAKRFAIFREQGWDFTQDEWEEAWINAGNVLIPGTQTIENPEGKIVPAYAMRGVHRYNSTCMQRLDNSLPWSKTNYKISYRGEDLVKGSKWHRP